MKRKLAIFGLLICLLLGVMLPAVPVTSAAAYDGQIELETLIDGTKRLFIAFEGEHDYGFVYGKDSNAVSLGILSWHAQRALNLLKKICAKDPALSREILGDTLYNEIVNSPLSAWKNRCVNDPDEKARISTLLRTDIGVATQEEQAREDILGYINNGWKAGVRTEAALLYYSSIENQYGSGGVKTYMKYVRQAMGITENDTINSLDEFHAAVKKASGTFTSYNFHVPYRNKVCDFVKNTLHWSTSGSLKPSTPTPPSPPPVCDNCPSAGFTDVPAPGNWAHEGIDYAISHGLFQGTSATTFSPDTNMTRAMLVTVLYRMEGKPAVSGAQRFADVSADSYYDVPVRWAAANGIVNGTSEDFFSPDSALTRQQLATILYRYSTYKRGNAGSVETFVLDGYGDSPMVAGYAREAFAWAVEKALIRGDTSTGELLLDPCGNATRAQVAVILMRYLTQN